MIDTVWAVILYPVLAEGLSDLQKEFLDTLGEEVSTSDRRRLRESLSQPVTLEDIKGLVAGIPESHRARLYSMATEIALIGGLSERKREALGELQSVLELRPEGANLMQADLEQTDDSEEHSFEQIRSRYCRITAVSSLLPLPFVSETLVLIPIQVRMVEKIAKLYHYPFNAKEFVKMVIRKAGPEYASAIAGRMSASLVPVLGWIAAAAITYGLTYAVAQIAREYVEKDGQISKDDIRTLYKKAYAHGRLEFSFVKEEIKKDRDILLDKLRKLGDHHELLRKLERQFDHIKDHIPGRK